MGKLIVCLGVEKNTGVTSSALAIGSVAANSLNKEVLLIDANESNPDVFSYLSNEDYLNKNIDIVMSYAMSTEHISSALKANTEKLTKSKLEIIMGTTSHENFTDGQYANLIKSAKEAYEIVVIDCSIDSIPGVILDYADTILLFALQSKCFLSKLAIKYRSIIDDEKCKIIISKFEENVLSLEKISAILNKKVEHKICYSKELLKKINNNDLNLSETKYEKDIIHLINNLFKIYGFKLKNNFSLSTFFKKNSHSKDVIEDVKIIR